MSNEKQPAAARPDRYNNNILIIFSVYTGFHSLPPQQSIHPSRLHPIAVFYSSIPQNRNNNKRQQQHRERWSTNITTTRRTTARRRCAIPPPPPKRALLLLLLLRCETWILYLTLDCNWFISEPLPPPPHRLFRLQHAFYITHSPPPNAKPAVAASKHHPAREKRTILPKLCYPLTSSNALQLPTSPDYSSSHFLPSTPSSPSDGQLPDAHSPFLHPLIRSAPTAASIGFPLQFVYFFIRKKT